MAALLGFQDRTSSKEAKMGLLEISMVLACASAIGFYIAADTD